MANQIEITSVYDIDSWVIQCRVTESSDADFPRNIFLWSVAENGSLDTFQAIGNIEQVARYPAYNPILSGNFGVHLVKTNNSTQRVRTDTEKDNVIIVLKSAFRILLDGFTAESIPEIEVYP